MGGFLDLVTPQQCLLQLAETIKVEPRGTEVLPFYDSLGRVIARPVVAPTDLPAFDRSTVDGFAVRAADTAGASETLPGYLQVIGEILMGETAQMVLRPGQAAKIATGGMLPDGADAVLMVEYTEFLDGTTIEFARSVAAGENLVCKGEDIAKGTVLFWQGHKVRPQDLGALAGLGITELEVYCMPKVALLSTGDELVSPYEEPRNGQVRDINTYSIGGLLRQLGCKVQEIGIVEDTYNRLHKAVEDHLDCDLLILSGGSSVGVKDMTVDLLNSFGEPGVIVHGVSIKPGKPTILGVVHGLPVVGLPGHPASAWNIATVLVTPIVTALRGEADLVQLVERSSTLLRGEVTAVLSRNLVSDRGKEEYVPVKIVKEPEIGLVARPVLGKSSLITTLAGADGYIRIDTFTEGLNQGELVKVLLY